MDDFFGPAPFLETPKNDIHLSHKQIQVANPNPGNPSFQRLPWMPTAKLKDGTLSRPLDRSTVTSHPIHSPGVFGTGIKHVVKKPLIRDLVYTI